MRLTMSDIFVVGSTMIDLVSYTPNLPKPGETVMGSTFAKSFGGKGANQAVQCALLGLQVEMCGKIGVDKFGQEYFNNFISHKINLDNLKRTSDATTGVACISVDESGTNTIVVIPAANNLITVSDIATAEPSFISSKVLICQNEIPHQATLEAFKLANKYLTLSIFNPAPALALPELVDIISLADIVCPNEIELGVLTGLPTQTTTEIETAAKQLQNQGGCKVVIVTLGDRGAMIVGLQSTLLVSVPEAYKCHAVDTVGAGDCFIGTLACNLARGASLQEAVHRAVCCASISVTRRGAQVSYPLLSELEPSLHPPVVPTEWSSLSIEDQKKKIRNQLMS